MRNEYLKNVLTAFLLEFIILTNVKMCFSLYKIGFISCALANVYSLVVELLGNQYENSRKLLLILLI